MASNLELHTKNIKKKMQMYPKEDGYEHYFAAVEEDYVVKGEHCNYDKGSSLQMMKPDYFKHTYDQSHHVYEGHNDHQFKHNYGQNHGYGGHNGQFKHNYDKPQGFGGHTDHQNYDKHHGFGGHNYHHKSGGESNYGQNHGYGGHNGQFMHNFNKHHGFGGQNDLHKSGGESYGETWYEEENDYSGQGGKHPNAGMKHSGYGAHDGHFGPHKELQCKSGEFFEEKSRSAPVWEFKGIVD